MAVEQSSTLPSRLLNSALSYAEHGFHVFPVRPHRKEPLIKDWPNRATTDEAIIRKWWSRHPDANIGIATGPSGIIAIDVDVKKGAIGMESWRDILQKHGQALGETLTTETPTGGLHVIYRSNGLPVRNSAGKLAPGIDVRANGGYIIAPPSIHPNGGAYSWAMGCALDNIELLPFPASLVKLLTEPTPRKSQSVGDVIPQGQRNQTLASLGGTMRRGGLSESAILAALKDTNKERCRPPLPDAEVAAVAHSISRYEPKDTAAPVGQLHQTDLGNARRLVALHGENLRYCYAWNKWLIWDGVRWHLDETGEIERLAKSTVQAIYAEAAKAADDERKHLARWGIRSESRVRIQAMVGLARSEPGIPIRVDDFDSDPWLFNCENGTLDLRTGTLRPHRREDCITKIANVPYDPEAACPRWMAFQERITGGDQEVMTFKRRAFGSALTGDTTDQVLFIHYGTGSNGKSTELNAIRAVVGDYGLHTPTETILVKRYDGIPNDIARLRGARYVTAIEAEAGRRLAEALIKQMTGGDPLTARFMRAEWFDFFPTHKLFLAVNHRPVIKGTDHAIWRRIRLVPYDVVIPDNEQDKHLPEKLASEAAGILAWLVEGCRQWREHGLETCEAVKQATSTYKEDMDVLAAFLADCCYPLPTAEVTSKELYAAYVQWAEGEGEKAISRKAIGSRLRERGFQPARIGHSRARGWRGIGLALCPD